MRFSRLAAAAQLAAVSSKLLKNLFSSSGLPISNLNCEGQFSRFKPSTSSWMCTETPVNVLLRSKSTTMSSSKPPFTPDNGLLVYRIPASLPGSDKHPSVGSEPPTTSSPKPDLILPATYERNKRQLQEVNPRDRDTFNAYLGRELSVDRLELIVEYLWLAGLPRLARPLHEQNMIGREIIATEEADLHLVWRGTRIYIKPLPEFLLCYGMWEHHLCKNEQLFKNACGLLLSYLWLVRHKSDLEVAHNKSLLSTEIQWEGWTALSREILMNIDNKSLHGINPRYKYGELRLQRLNYIYRFSPKTWSFTNFLRGYLYGYHEYSTFFQRNTAWLLASFAYITIVLTAMQVGLATPDLGNNRAFRKASYVFTVFSILSPLAVLSGVMGTVIVLAINNYLYTVSQKKRRQKKAQPAFLGVGHAPNFAEHC
jgi:hypothetical protein